TVGKYMRAAGVHVIDADDLARRAVAKGQPALNEIERRFGPGVLHDGELDRPALGQLVFSNAQRLAELNAIVHPRVAELLQQELARVAALSRSDTPLMTCYE